MRHPPYHLRPNKAVDRFLLVEILRKLSGYAEGFEDYTYYGFGGPFLEDFRIMGQVFPHLRMVSIEKSKQTFDRQTFHKPSKNVRLVNTDLRSFLADFEGGERTIFWLDFTDLRYSNFDVFWQILTRVGERSVVRITLRADAGDSPIYVPPDMLGEKAEEARWKAYLDDFGRKFGTVIPSSLDPSRFRRNNFPTLLQEMVRIAAQRALPATAGVVFQVVGSCVYSDQTQMLTVTGVVCRTEEQGAVRECFRGWDFANVRWGAPKRIDLPVLSIKERLMLEKHLPCKSVTGKSLCRALGYNVDGGPQETLRKMRQYGDFHLLYPLFARVVV